MNFPAKDVGLLCNLNDFQGSLDKFREEKMIAGYPELIKVLCFHDQKTLNMIC